MPRFHKTLASLVAALVAATAASCSDNGTEEERVAEVEQALECRYVSLVAGYTADGLYQDAEETFSPPLRFTIPAHFGVGGHRSELGTLSFGHGGEIVSCTYVGPFAERVHFESCSSGAVAGDVFEADWVRLHLRAEPYPYGSIHGHLDEVAPCLADCDLGDDNDPCTLEHCDPATGAVTHSACVEVEPGVTTTMADALSVLTDGANPIQAGLTPGAIDEVRAAAVVGHVYGPGGLPVIGATVTILGQGELGETTTDIHGRYIMAVNGGAPVTVDIKADGFLPTQRTLDVGWQRYGHVPDVVVVPLDPNATEIDLDNMVGIEVAAGGVVSDSDGTRQAVVMFTPGTGASFELPNGTLQPASVLTMRLTEYTVGDDGPERMPASLPPQTAYTYAVEISADEAIAAGATGIVLDQPVSVFVDNFLEFGVGSAVPVGRYARHRGVWEPSPDAVVIEIVDEVAGLALVDVTGDGLEDPLLYADYGLSDDERAELALRYGIGKELMHGELMHFSPHDMNVAGRISPEACAPLECGPEDPPFEVRESDDDSPCERPGSTIECTNQVLRESASVAGTPFSIHYSSARTRGGANYSVTLPISGPVISPTEDSLPAELSAIHARLFVAGQVIEQTFTCPCAHDAFTTLTWDGKDLLGREVLGQQPATIELSYEYPLSYSGGTPVLGAAGFARMFATWAGVIDWNLLGRERIELRRRVETHLGRLKNESYGLGGFSLDSVHSYDTQARSLYRGDGTRRHRDVISAKVDNIGSAQVLFALAVNHEDNLLLGYRYVKELRKRAPDGTETVIASGSGQACNPADPEETPIFNSCILQFQQYSTIVPAPDGSIYVGNGAGNGNRIVRVVPREGKIYHVAGKSSGSSAEGIDARGAWINSYRMALAPDGSLYIVEPNRVRRIGPDGTIKTVGGGPTVLHRSTPLPIHVSEVRLQSVHDLAFGPDGSLFLLVQDSTNYKLLVRVRPDGMVSAVAGQGQASSAEGVPAVDVAIRTATELAIARDGTLFFPDRRLGKNVGLLRAITPDGIIRTVAGFGTACPDGPPSGGVGCGWGGPALAAHLLSSADLQVSPRGDLVAHNGNNLYRVTPALPPHGKTGFLVAEEDGRTIYRFDAKGRHLDTTDAETGAVLYEMAYDVDGRLTSITDVDGLETTITRDPITGAPTAIVAPYGQQTTLGLDANGYLATIQDPEGGTWTAVYQPDGLMTSWTNRNNHSTSFIWDGGKLVSHTNAGTGEMTFDRTETTDGRAVQEVTALGRTTDYTLEWDDLGREIRTTTFPSGLTNTSIRTGDGERVLTLPDGTTITTTLSPDPVLSMQAPFVSSRVLDTPSTLPPLVVNSTRSVTPDPPPTDPLAVLTRTTTTTIDNKTWTRVFDRTARTETRTSPLGRTTTRTYDTAGRLAQLQIPGQLPIAYGYDLDGRLETVQQGTRLTTTVYDSQGYPYSVTNAENETTVFDHDSVGRVLRVVRPDSKFTELTYDGEGNQTTVTPPDSETHGMTYGIYETLATYDPPELDSWSPSTEYQYNLDKQVTQLETPDSLLTRLYDSAGRLWKLVYDGGEILHTYHPATGKLASLMNTTSADSVVLDFAYDGPLMTAVRFSGALDGGVSWGYDTSFRMVEEAIEDMNGFWGQVNFTYDDDSLLTGADGISIHRDLTTGRVDHADSGLVVDTIADYTDYGEVEARVVTVAGTSPSTLLDVSYVRDGLGRITQKTESTLGGTPIVTEYAYDAAGRLWQVKENGAQVEYYEYDSNGNRTYTENSAYPAGVFASFDAQDRIGTYGDWTFTFSDNGVLQRKESSATSDFSDYVYDALGNLLSFETFSGFQIDYVVDGRGRRVRKWVNGDPDKQWLWRNQLQPVAELDETSVIRWAFIYAGGVNVPDLITDGSDTYRLVKDHLGSVRLVVNVATGVVVQQMRYDAFGRVLYDSNPGFQPFGFAGGLYDPDTGLVRFGARDYDAEIGRWTTKDPIRFAGGINLYAYVAGDPVNRRDPLGLCDDGAGGACPDRGEEGGPPTYEDLTDNRPHFDRNYFNDCPPTEPQECDEWDQDWWSDKWRGSDGSECVYDDSGDLIPGEGSFNYCPDPFTMCHIFMDVLPHFTLGGDYTVNPSNPFPVPDDEY